MILAVRYIMSPEPARLEDNLGIIPNGEGEYTYYCEHAPMMYDGKQCNILIPFRYSRDLLALSQVIPSYLCQK